MKLGLAPILPLVLAVQLASPAVAQAPEPPSLRAAPPAAPDVLRAAPDPGAVAQEWRDVAGRWLGAGDPAVQELNKAAAR
jgi:hypothetical protein